MASIDLVAIQSVHFPTAYLRMDGGKVTAFNGAGSGTVNCQYYGSGTLPVPSVGNLEVFELIPMSGFSHGYGLRSVNDPGAFLRIDGSQVKASEGAGSGTVNCQYYASGSYPTAAKDDELLILQEVKVGSTVAYSIRANPFTNAYLRMDGTNVTAFNGSGSGVVNCQFYPTGQGPSGTTSYELFKVIPLPSFSGPF